MLRVSVAGVFHPSSTDKTARSMIVEAGQDSGELSVSKKAPASGQSRTRYQQGIIRRYYEHRDTLMLQKLGDLVGDLYLAEGKARARLWERVATALKNLSSPPERIQHLVESDNPGYLANLLQELQRSGGRS